MSKSFIVTGLISYDPKKAFNGYTLYAPMQLPTPKWNGLYSEPSYAYLIDMNGIESQSLCRLDIMDVIIQEQRFICFNFCMLKYKSER